jgi:hypothetical protein
VDRTGHVQGALIIALGREDVVLPGDLALRKAVQAAYQLDHLPSEQEVLAIADRWRTAGDAAAKIAQLQSFGVTSLYIRGFYSYKLPAELCDRFSRDVMPLMPASPGPGHVKGLGETTSGLITCQRP